MKFALRDDDLNFFFSPDIIEKNFKDIWEICPVSMSVVPFIKGDWPKNVKEAEERGPGAINSTGVDKINADCAIYPVGDNTELVSYIKNKISKKKVYLAIHAIHHRNEDPIIPQFSNNFGTGAEFYTSRDLTLPLNAAKKYIESIFNQPIEIFTPPQNLLNLKGIEAITNNGLAICGDLPSLKKVSTIKILGMKNFIKYAAFKIKNKDIAYPYPLISNDFKIIGHQRLQPGTNIEKLYSSFEQTYKLNGSFVVSTHSYAFDYKMKSCTKTMGETLKEFIHYAAQKPNVQFVNLKQIFDK